MLGNAVLVEERDRWVEKIGVLVSQVGDERAVAPDSECHWRKVEFHRFTVSPMPVLNRDRSFPQAWQNGSFSTDQWRPVQVVPKTSMKGLSISG